MKKFLIVLAGILLLAVFLAFIVSTFVVETIAKILNWLTGLQRQLLENIKVYVN